MPLMIGEVVQRAGTELKWFASMSNNGPLSSHPEQDRAMDSTPRVRFDCENKVIVTLEFFSLPTASWSPFSRLETTLLR